MKFYRNGTESTGRMCPVVNVFTKVFTKVIRKTQDESALLLSVGGIYQVHKENTGRECPGFKC